MDRIPAQTRSRVMSRIRSKNTKPEMIVRAALHRAGYRFRLHKKELPGTPDIALAHYKTVIFINGCFWHGHDCAKGKLPTSNVEFWQDKIDRNRARDNAATETLLQLGWRVIVIWECALEKGILDTLETLSTEKCPERT